MGIQRLTSVSVIYTINLILGNPCLVARASGSTDLWHPKGIKFHFP